ncbi:MAG: hypothetical protein FWC92_04250, partial [Defluviitaleaceae bacterium]|nr:hypothetical protein [Defluviitaleaceae bacterium]
FLPLFVAPSLLALMASRVRAASIGKNLSRKVTIVRVEYSFLFRYLYSMQATRLGECPGYVF